MNFSVCLIAKNEEKTLPRLLGSLKEFQERGGVVLLLDTGSTDKTVEVAKSFGVLVHEVGNKFLRTIENADEINGQFIFDGEEAVVKNGQTLFDYSSARNYIAQFAPTDMIATPDCDEEYTKLDIDKVQELIDSGVEQLEYNFVFSHDEYGNEAIKFMHSKFYNRKKAEWVGIIHEVLKGDVKRQFVDESIIKLEHWQQPDERRGNYLPGLALDCYENPNNERNSHYFGRELLWTGRYHSAIIELKRCISMHWWPEEIAQSKIYIARAYGFLNQPEEQLRWLHDAFDHESSRREALIELARFHQHNKNYQAAVCYAAAALEIPSSTFYGNSMAHYTFEPHEIMYQCYGWMGNIQQAKFHLDVCLKYQPLNSDYLRDYRYYNDLPLISIIIPTLNRPEGLQKCLDSIKKLNYPQDLIETVVLDGPGTVPEKVAKGVEKAKGDILIYGSDDVEFTPNSVIIAYLERGYRMAALIAFNTGEILPDQGNINEHFMIDRGLLPLLDGEIFDTDFHHVGVDNLLWAKCQKLGVAYRSANAIVKHNHFTRGAAMDETYNKGWSHVEEDRALLKEKLAELEIV